jgi:hypothetical protein
MKKMLLALVLCSPFMIAHAENSQQSKMASCNKDATGKKGDDRKAFMKDCLSAKPSVEAKKLTPQQEKMKSCNADAKDMKGDDRKKLMSACLKKS